MKKGKIIKILLVILFLTFLTAIIIFFIYFNKAQKSTDPNTSYIFCSCISSSEINIKQYAKEGNCAYTLKEISSEELNNFLKEEYDMSTLENEGYLLIPKSKIINPSCSSKTYEDKLLNIYIDKSGKYMDCDCRNF